MKKWFDYQMAHQVVDYNWDNYLQPVANLNSVLSKTFEQIKTNYYSGHYNPQLTSYFTDRSYLDTAGGTDVSAETLAEWINDPLYAGLLEKNGIDVFKLMPDEYRVLRTFFVSNFDLEPENLGIVVHLQQPGQILAMHVDRVKNTEVNLEKNKLSAEPRHTKYLAFFDDWQWGQVFQMGTEFLKWQAGDVFTWTSRDVPHGTANMGYEPRFMLVINGIIKS